MATLRIAGQIVNVKSDKPKEQPKKAVKKASPKTDDVPASA